MLTQQHLIFVNHTKHKTRRMSSGKCTTFVYTTFHVPSLPQAQLQSNLVLHKTSVKNLNPTRRSYNQLIISNIGQAWVYPYRGPARAKGGLCQSRFPVKMAALVKSLALHLLINSSKCIYCKQPLWDGIQLRGDAEHPLVPPRSQAEDCSR